MTGTVFAIVLASAATGGGAAFLLWVALEPLRQRLARPVDLAPQARSSPGPTVKTAVAEKPSFLGRGGAAPVPQGLAADLGALRADIATIASAQIALLNEQAAREGRVLAEMRAVASAPAPELIRRLRRIESLLTGGPDTDDETDDGPDPEAALEATELAPQRTIPVDGQLLNMFDHPRAGAADDPKLSAR